MKKLKSFIFTALLGGLTVILPVAILIGVFTWIFNFVTNLIQPFTNIIVVKAEFKEIVADIIVIAIIITLCFVIGIFVRTRFGKCIYALVENNLLKIAPGYTLIKETILQILGNKKAPFSAVALANIYANDVLATCFITDEHADGSYTVFVPTGPNPTSGNIFHLKPEHVHIVDVSVEDAMRSIISCGAGSTMLLESLGEKI
ncbi:MAG: DUF502 domain-containing protein [Candidatus Omnitrophica bacterium]|nr:DUF502 domain-containing protein [Candidatus Omnitrophota bacterium]